MRVLRAAGGFFEGFSKFPGAAEGFLGFFEGCLLALESLCLAVAASSFFPRFSDSLIFFDLIFFKFSFFGHFSNFRPIYTNFTLIYANLR